MIKSSKHKKFSLDYIGIDKDQYDVLYHNTGNYSVIINFQNNSIDREDFLLSHKLFKEILLLLGEGFSIQKYDVFSNNAAYNKSFTYLAITRMNYENSFFIYKKKTFTDFNSKIEKIIDLLDKYEFNPFVLDEKQIRKFITQFLKVDFSTKSQGLKNLKLTNENIELNNDILQSISILKIDEEYLVKNNTNVVYDNNKTVLPTNMFSFLKNYDSCKTIIYHQFIEIPFQRKELFKLKRIEKRLENSQDPASIYGLNLIKNKIEFFKSILLSKPKKNKKKNDQTIDLEVNKEIIIYGHFNFLLKASNDNIQSAINRLEKEIGSYGMITSSNDYNQLELFKGAFPGHISSLTEYNKFLTSLDVGVSLLYKEKFLFTQKLKKGA